MTSLLDDTDSRHDPDESGRPASVVRAAGYRRVTLTDKWVDYPAATAALERMEKARSQRLGWNRCHLLIVASSNNGKTSLVKRFAALHPPRYDVVAGVSVPVLVLSASPELNRSRFIYGIYESLFMPYKRPGTRDIAYLDRLVVSRLLRYVNLEVLVIDDLHHVLTTRQADRKRLFDTFRTAVPDGVVIAASTAEEHARFLLSHPEIRNNFEIVHLPKWRMGSDYLRFLEDLGCEAPLTREMAQATPKKTAKAILKASGGTIGGIVSAATGFDYRGRPAVERCVVTPDSAAAGFIGDSG